MTGNPPVNEPGLRDALLAAQSYIAYLRRDATGDEDHLDDDGEPYHDDGCDTCRETRLSRLIEAALSV